MFSWFKKAKSTSAGPDFSHVTSKEKAQELFQRGELKKLFLMPLEFGGADAEINVMYVPAFAVQMKARVDTNIIKPLIEQGKVKHYSATPEYQGISFIPCAIKIEASDPADFSTVINIWGNALNRDPLDF